MGERHFDLAASTLGAELSDARALTEALAVKLEAALPGQTKVSRRGTRMLSREKRVERIEVQLGEDAFTLAIRGEATETSRARTVGGIVIRRELLALAAWLDALSRALEAEAERSEAARQALERLLG
jgi:hypothetical protein